MKNTTIQTLTTLKKWFFFLVLLLTMQSGWGQTTYIWDGSATAATSGSNANITSAAFNTTQGNNNGTTPLISATSTSSGYTGSTGTSNFGAACLTGALNTSASTYFSLVITPTSTYKVQLNSISLGSRGTTTGPTTITVYSSIDNYATAIGSAAVSANSAWALSSITFSGSNLVGASSTAVTLRIYGSGGTGTASANTANWRIDDVSLNVTSLSSGSTVTFNPSGGSITTTTQTASTATNLTSASSLGLSRTGYTFGGWATSAANATAGTVAYADSASYSFSSSTTLYAIWTPNSLVVTYNSQGGGAISNGSTTTGGSISTSPGTPTRSGYTFNGWFAAASGGTAITFPYTHGQTANFTLYAQWSANALVVTYNTQGGSAISNGSTTTGGSISTSPGTPTRLGYAFNGWFAASSGGTAISFPYAHGQTADFTLYSQWTANNNTITFNSNGGSGSMGDQTIATAASANLTTNAFTRTGYSFAGWNTLADGTGISYADGASYTMGTGNVTLYAKWTINTYTFSYNGNGSDGGAVPVDSSSPYNYNSSITVLGAGTLTYTGFTFAGWNTIADGSGTSYSAGATFPNIAANIILYAQWTSNSAPVCPFSTAVAPTTTQTLCQSATASTLTATITTAGNSGSPTYQYQWYYNTTNSNTITGATAVSGATNSTFTPLTTSSEVGTRYYFCVGYATDNSCTSSSTTQSLASPVVQVTVVATPSAPSGSASQAFCGSGTVAGLTATGTAIQWYDAATGGNLVASSTSLVDATPYYASQTVNGCESTSRLDVTVTINSIPGAPTGTASQSFCGSATIASLAATGTSVQWYAAASGGSALSNSASLVSGTHYYASQTISGCASSSRLDVTATINTIPTAPSGSASQAFCVSGTVAGLTATGTAIQWYDAATGGNLVTSSTAIVSGTHYYASQTINGCESNSRFDVTATINSLPSAPTGSASQSFCGSATVASLVATGSTIQWYDAATGGNLLTSSTALVDATHYYASQTVNGCESSSRLDITTTIVAVPATPTASNNGPVCLNEALTLSTPTVSGATYAWTGPNGFNDTTQNPTVSAAATAAMAGTYSVTVTVSGCTSAAGTTTVTVNSALVVGSVSGIATPIYGSNLVISQLYCGGGNTGATYTTKFIELYNPTASSISLNGWSLTYINSGGTKNKVPLSTASIPSGKYYLIALGSGSTGATLPVSIDLTVSNSPSATSGTMVLHNTTTALVSNTDSQIVDMIGWGSPNTTWFEGSAKPAASSAANSLIRNNNGCTDSNNNSADFVSATVTPRNSATAANTCTTPVYTETICTGTTPSAASVTSASGSTGNYTYQWYSYNGITTPTATPATSSWTAVNTGQNLTTTSITQSTTYACYITPVGCGAGAWASNYRQVTVNANNTVGNASSSPTLCINTALTAITHATTGATGIGTATGLPTGVTASWSSNTITISGTPTASGTFNYSIPLTGGCGSVNATGTIVVSPVSVAGTASGSVSICAGNSVSVSLSGNTGTIQWQQSLNGTSGWANVTGGSGATTSSYTTPNLTVTTYYRAVVTSGVCSTANSNTVTVTVNPLPTLTLGYIDDVLTTDTSFSIPFTAISGSPDQYSIVTSTLGGGASTIVMPNFTAVTNATLGSSPILVTIPASSAAEYGFVLTVTNSTTGCSKDYPFQFHVTSVSHGVIGTNQTICSGATPAPLTSVTDGSSTFGSISYTWEQSTTSVNTGYTTISGETGAGYSPGALTQTTYYKRVTHYTGTNPDVASDSDPVTITVNASVGGTVGGSTSICSGATSGVLTLSGHSGSVVRWESAVSPFTSWTTISNTATTYTSGVLTETTKFRAVVNNNSCGEATASPATITISTTTYDGTSWSNGVPDSSKAAIFTGNYTIAADLTACSLRVTNNAVVSVSSNYNVNLNGAITVDSGSSFTLNNNSNLLQSDATAVNTGNIIVKRNTSNIVRLDHTLWSSPVTGQNLFSFSPNTLVNRFYVYNTATNSYVTTGLSNTSLFTPAKGFAVRAPNNQSATTPAQWTGTFTGVPNNGTKTFTLATDAANGYNYNLVGNPYPSALSASDFYAANSSVIGGTLYFYAHTLTMNSSGLFPTGTNYATWTGLGGAAATAGDGHTAAVAPNGIIQVGQGFIVKATAAGDVTFTNAMRVANQQNQFMKAATTTAETHRMWLNLKTDTGVDVNQILVGYMDGATQGVDADLDGLSFGNTGSYLYSKIDSNNYVIQARSLPFATTDEVPLGFNCATAGTYSISLTNKDGLFAGSQDVLVRDNLTGTDTSIKTAPYTFTSDAGVFDSRFKLVYQQALGVPSTNFTENSVIVYKNTDWFHVTTKGIEMKDIMVYDISGRLIYSQKDINATTTVLNGLSTANQVLLLKITSQEGKVVTIKVIN